MAGAFDQPQFGGAVRLRQLACVNGRHAVIVVTVHHEKWSRRQPPGSIDGTEPSELASPLIERRRKARCANRADVASMLQESSGLRSPVVEVGARTQQRGTAYAWVIGGDAGDHRATGVRSDQPDAGRSCFADEVVDRSAQIVDPTLQREVTLAVAAAAEVERHRRPTELVGHAIDQLRERARALPGVEGSDRKSVAQDHTGQRTLPPGRPRQIARQREVAGTKLAVHTLAYALGLRTRRLMPGRAR